MNSIERTLLTLAHQPPDRVPVSLPNFMVTARVMGTDNFAEFFRDGEAMAEGQVKTWQRFGHDMVIIENGTAALAEACGVQVIYQSSTAPVATEPAIKSLDEIDQLRIPDPYTHPLLIEMLKATRRVVNEIGDQAFIMGRADQGPFSLACEIRGMSLLMMDIALGEEPQKIHQLIDYCRQVVYRYALAQIDQGAHCTSIGESPSGPDLLSPRHYRKYAYPHVQQLMADFNSKGVRCSYHICGNATPIIGDMVNTGAPMIEIDQKADMTESKAAARGKATLIGPVDPSDVLAKGTVQQVIEKSRQAIDILAPGGGFILGPGCAQPATTPDENILALIETAKTYGKYN
jgi:uroporphyrinogen decarboxylase